MAWDSSGARGAVTPARLGFDSLVVVCDAGNPASRRVIEKNGGRLTGVYGDFLRFEVPVHGRNFYK